MEPTEKMALIDGHAHLDEISDLSLSLAEAKEAGVMAVVAVGSNVEANQKVLEMAAANPGYIFPAIGYHPWEIKEEEVKKTLLFLQDRLAPCLALGEIGLDYKAKVKKDLQHRVFAALLDLANQFDKPVIVHCRYSHERSLKMVMEKKIRRALFHWYSGPLNILDEIIGRGYFISATPATLYSLHHQEAIKRAPLESILLETDTPVSYQGMESRPKHVRITLEQVARLKGLDMSTVANQTTANACHFFGLPSDICSHF